MLNSGRVSVKSLVSFQQHDLGFQLFCAVHCSVHYIGHYQLIDFMPCWIQNNQRKIKHQQKC